MTEADLRHRFPWIRWRDPVLVRVLEGQSGLACRICVALVGLRAADTEGRLFPDEAAFRAHLAEIHPSAQA